MPDHLKAVNSVHFIRKLNEDPSESKKIQKICNDILTILPADIEIIEDGEDIGTYRNPVLISIGGDGTSLYGMKLSSRFGVPLVTVNLGRLGFLADIDPKKLKDLFSDMLRGDFVAEERLILESNGHIAANEFFIGPSESGRLLRYKIFLDGVLASKQEADGVIISTPTGSTGYSMSAGGSIMAPGIRALQIIPVSPHTLTSRPLVVKFNTRVSVTFEAQDTVILKSDGRKVKEFEDATNINITSYDKPAVLLHPDGWDFYSILSEKLSWNL